MTISYDPETKRATDSETGMAVEYVRDDYPMERGEFHKLFWLGREYPFRVSYGAGERRIKEQYPDLSIIERASKKLELNLLEYSIGYLHGLEENPAFLEKIDVFISLFHEVVQHVSPRF